LPSSAAIRYRIRLVPLHAYLYLTSHFALQLRFTCHPEPSIEIPSLSKASKSHTHKPYSHRFQVKMCLFSTPHRHRNHRVVEEVYVAPRPVSSHHHHHHHNNGRSSYTSVTRTSRPVSKEYIPPRLSQTSYRRSVPVVVEQRRSTRSYR